MWEQTPIFHELQDTSIIWSALDQSCYELSAVRSNETSVAHRRERSSAAG